MATAHADRSGEDFLRDLIRAPEELHNAQPIADVWDFSWNCSVEVEDFRRRHGQVK
jgi:hypothetical protein